MNKKELTEADTRRTAVTKPRPDGIAPLIAEVRQLVQSARRNVASVIDTFQVMTNFEIGRRIVEHEQKGEKRAAYGSELLIELSTRLTEEFGKGFSRSNLQNMRTFFLLWKDRVPKICQQPAGKLPVGEKSQQPAGELLAVATQPQPAANFAKPFTVSWTHYVLLLTIKDPDERRFYEIEATNEGWSVPALEGTAQSQTPRMDPCRRRQGVNLKTSFEKFELFAVAPNAVAKLRELVLELAIQGIVGELTSQAPPKPIHSEPPLLPKRIRATNQSDQAIKI